LPQTSQVAATVAPDLCARAQQAPLE